MPILTEAAIECSLAFLKRHGDTDLFPTPIELPVLCNDIPIMSKQLALLDLAKHNPGSSRRFIVPKDELSFRAATQLDPIDSVILTALIYQFGQGIETRRRPSDENSVFSNRFSPSPLGELYESIGSWNKFWTHCLDRAGDANYFLVIDIADFYNQVYHHTIENQLLESAFPSIAVIWIKRLFQSVTARVSRGIPVGPHATHLIAEASLIPVDNSLKARDIDFARYVDDIVVFCDNRNEAIRCLYEIVVTLDKQQRLHLQRNKTRVLTRAEFMSQCYRSIEDRPINAFEAELLRIIGNYSGGDPYEPVYLSDLSAEDYAAIKDEAIEEVILAYLADVAPDYARLRWFLRRLAQLGHPGAVRVCLKNIGRLWPALNEICRYLRAVQDNLSAIKWDGIGSNLIELFESDLVQRNDYLQLTILSLFGVLKQLDHIPTLVRRFASATDVAKREIIIAACRAQQTDWLRELKEDVPRMDPWGRKAYLWAASSLPDDERQVFFRTVKPDGVLEDFIMEWGKKQ